MDQVSSPGKPLSSQVHTRKLPANAQQVAEIFKATGEAFSAIGDCVMMMDHKAPPKTKVSARFYYESVKMNSTDVTSAMSDSLLFLANLEEDPTYCRKENFFGKLFLIFSGNRKISRSFKNQFKLFAMICRNLVKEWKIERLKNFKKNLRNFHNSVKIRWHSKSPLIERKHSGSSFEFFNHA